MLNDEKIDEIAGPADYFDRRVFARAIEAEVQKQDTALIRKMWIALKNCRATGALDDQAHDLACDAINAGRARLKDAP